MQRIFIHEAMNPIRGDALPSHPSRAHVLPQLFDLNMVRIPVHVVTTTARGPVASASSSGLRQPGSAPQGLATTNALRALAIPLCLRVNRQQVVGGDREPLLTTGFDGLLERRSRSHCCPNLVDVVLFDGSAIGVRFTSHQSHLRARSARRDVDQRRGDIGLGICGITRPL
jgi:hypothetical protein